MAYVLLVDDDADGREALRRFLEQREGHRVEVVGNGKAALTAVIDRTPDLVVLDLLMPDMDGANFLDVVRSYARLQSLPVIVLTALRDGPMVEDARHLKVDAVLLKGEATLDQVAAAVRAALQRLSAPPGLTGASGAAAADPSPCSH